MFFFNDLLINYYKKYVIENKIKMYIVMYNYSLSIYFIENSFISTYKESGTNLSNNNIFNFILVI